MKLNNIKPVLTKSVDHCPNCEHVNVKGLVNQWNEFTCDECIEYANSQDASDLVDFDYSMNH